MLPTSERKPDSETETHLTPSSSSAVTRYAWVGVSAVIVCFLAYQARDQQLDDAMIYLRYFRNFWAGDGLVYNEGVWFNGLSSPLFSYLMIALTGPFQNFILVATVLSGISMFGAVVALALAFGSSAIQRTIISITLASFGYFYNTFGLETSLFLFLIGSSFCAYRFKPNWLPIIAAFAFITRGEGMFLGFLILADIYRSRRIPSLSILVAFLISCTPLLVNWALYGQPLAETAGAKTGQGQSGLWGPGIPFFQTQYLVDWFFSGKSFAVVSLLLLATKGIFSSLEKLFMISIASFLITLATFYVIFYIPNYHWYYAPFFYVLLGLAALGVADTMENWVKRTTAKSFVSSGAIFSAAVVATYAALMVNIISLDKRQPFQPYVDIGKWLNEHTRPSSSVAMVEIGAVGWHSERTIIDILGLVNPYNAEYIGDLELHQWLTHYQPDYILTHTPRWPHEVSAETLLSLELYAKVQDFPFPGYELIKKNEDARDTEIAFIAEKIGQSQILLNEIVDAEGARPGYFEIKGHKLYAHAPSAFRITLPEASRSIDLMYSIDERAKGQHFGVCFAVSAIKETADSEIFNDCILPADQRTTRQARLQIEELEGDAELEFEISCMTECSYAWTSWDLIYIDLAK